jgi:hypothetical protein
LFQSLLLFTINEFSAASIPTRGVLILNLCATFIEVCQLAHSFVMQKVEIRQILGHAP